MNTNIDLAQLFGRETTSQDLRSRSVRGAAALAVGTGGETVVRLASIVVLARLLLPEEFGVVAMVTALTAAAGTLSQLGLSTPTVQRREIGHGEVTNLFWIGIGLGAAFSLLFAMLAWPIARFYSEPQLVAITLSLSTTFLLGSVSIQHEALLIRAMRQPRAAAVRFVATSIGIGVAIVLAWLGAGAWALVFQEVVRTVLVTVGFWAACPWRPGKPDRRHDVRDLVRFGAHLTFTQLLNVVGSSLDKLLVGRLFGAGALGLYRQAQQLVLVPIEQLNSPIANVAQPGLSILQDDPQRYRRYYHRIVGLVGMLTVPVAVFAMVFAERLTVLILGHNWAGATPFFLIFAAAALIRPVLGTTTPVLVSRGRSLQLLWMVGVSQATYVALMCLGAFWGAEGIALAFVITPVILLIPNAWWAFRGSPVQLRDFFVAVLRPLVAGGVMAAFLWAFRQWLPEPGVMALVVAALVGVSIFCSCLLALPGGREELRALVADVLAAITASARPTGGHG
jgi:PST family polysaccharide transporter